MHIEPNAAGEPPASLVCPADRAAYRAAFREAFRRLAEAGGERALPTLARVVAPAPDAKGDAR